MKPAKTLRFPSSRRYWLNMARFLGLCLLGGALILAIRLGVLGVKLANEGLHPPRLPVEGSPRDVALDEYQDVSFTTTDGLVLRGWYIPSRNGAALILGHGQAANRTQLLPEAAIFAQHGYGVLLFDWRTHGESDGEVGSLGYREVQDLQAAIDLVAARPDVDSERIGALGFSMGAAVVTEVAARDTRLKAVVIEAAFPTLAEMIRFRTRDLAILGPIATWWGEWQIGAEVDQVRPVHEICRISPRPVLLIYGSQDEMLPPDSAEQMFAAACEPKELWLIEGAGHGGYHQLVPQEYARRLLAFFDQALSR